MEGLTIAISIIALMVSISSFQWNKAKHNLNQLQDNAKKFCDNLQEFIKSGTEHHLTSFKFEIENIYHITDKEKKNIAYNNLQFEFSKRKDICQRKHQETIESIDFFWVQRDVNNNELVKWLNEILNDYYLKLNRFYNDLPEIDLIVLATQKGLLGKEQLDFVNSFFDNIRDLLDYYVALLVLKKELAGYFGRLSLVDVGLFGSTKKTLIKIENDIMRLIKEFGYKEAIMQKDYTKIKKLCLDFGEGSDEFVEEEKTDFLKFLSAVKDMKN